MSGEIAWLELLMGLLGGLALFLYGMELMGDALKSIAGARMRSILAALSNNRVVGLITGAVVTAIIQSSSVTTVMLVGFVSAGLMSLSQSVGVILGADIGTTITAQIVAFKVTKYALLLIAAGFVPVFVGKNERIRQYGYLVLGLGLIFFGMHVMSASMKPLRAFQPFLDLMAHMDAPVAGIAVAAAFTALIQSSSAAMGVVIVLAMQGVITLEAGVALALGANIGTCATAGLAAIGKPREAVRVAVAHVLFKITGVVVVLPFIPAYCDLVRLISPDGDPTLSGQAALAVVVPRQVANAHTLFNVAIAFAFLPLTVPFARLVERLVPDRPLEPEKPLVRARHLDDLLLKAPGLALSAARRELHRIGEKVEQIVIEGYEATCTGDSHRLVAVQADDEVIDRLYGQVMSYLGAVSREELGVQQTAELISLMSIANELESIGDVVETDMVALGHRRLDTGVVISDQTRALLERLHLLVLSSVRLSVEAVAQADPHVAARVMEQKSEVNRLVTQLEAHQAQRLVAPEPGRLEAYSFEIDLVDKLRRVYYHAKRVAKAVVSASQAAAAK